MRDAGFDTRRTVGQLCLSAAAPREAARRLCAAADAPRQRVASRVAASRSPVVGCTVKVGSTSASTRTMVKRAGTREALRSLKCSVADCPVSTRPNANSSELADRNGYLPMPPILSVCDVWPGTWHTQWAT